MRQIQRILISFFVVLSISGCAGKFIYVPTKCVIPTVPYMAVDNSDKNTTLGEAKQCASNYFRVRQNYDTLSEAIKVCQ